MALQSINIELTPSSLWLSDNTLTNETYAGYYLNISYNHILSGTTVFAKERVEVEDLNQFRFFAPKTDDLVNGEIKVEVKAPNGEILFSIVGAVNSFHPAPKQKGKKDESNPYSIEINPISQAQLSTTINKPISLKLKGRVIDISGTAKVSNLQVIVWATESTDTSITFDTNNFKAIFVGKTDKDGYFFGSYDVKPYQKAFATVSNSTENTVSINIDADSKLESPIIIALDFSSLDINADDCSCETNTPTLPNGNALVESDAFSQDLGGHCVNFTTPNRTLEEFLFCYAVRTTEPEIKGLTLNDKEVKLIRKELIKTHRNFADKVAKLNHSVLTIEMKSIEEIAQMEQMTAATQTKTSAGLQPQMMMMRSGINASTLVSQANTFQHREYQLANVREIAVRPDMVGTQLSSLKSQLTDALKDAKKIQETIDKFEDSIGTSISISEIYEYRELYQELKKSVVKFQNLLESYSNLYSSFNHLLLISDVYFVNNYENLKTSFQDYLNEIELRINEIEKTYIANHPGRKNVSVENPIDWDDEPTIYQNTTIAHGHLLCFKQQWKAAGYSLGDLLYSLPLAPCQKKQIAIFDWNREEVGSRSEIQTNEERLTAQLIRNRAVEEMMTSNLSERSKGSSESSGKTSGWSASASVSVPVGPALVGASGGYSSSKTSANSSASQSSSRNLSANAMNNLMDSVQQSASSVRSQRSTVIQTVRQGESFNVTTEVIANHNHCHSLTVQYFEVLRHFVIEQNLVEVSECLFVPLEMSMFTIHKILRWKNNLRSYLLDRSLLRAFDSLERIKDKYKNSDLKNVNGSYSEETIEDLFGELRISFEIPRPDDPNNDADLDSTDAAIRVAIEQRIRDSWRPYSPFMFGHWSSSLSLYKSRFRNRIEAQRDRIFEEEVVPKLVKNFVKQLKIKAVLDDNTTKDLEIDVTLISKYKRGVPLYITMRPTPSSYGIVQRNRIKQILIHSPADVPETANIILHSGSLRYKTKHLDEFLFNSTNINNDIVHNDAAILYTPLNSRELINPKNEDYNLSNQLISHLNEYLEYYHRQLWQYMDNARLFNLLDGFIAPNSQGRSVSSVVENNIIGVIGNNLVMKVSSGYNLDPTFRIPKQEDGKAEFSDFLFEHYKPVTPADPFRVSVPTKGVYAEAVMGACNSCEHIDESRHWRFTEVPCGDEPTAINPINTDSRRADPGNLQSKNIESPVINIQNAPAAPDPTSLGAALQLMGKSDVFNDITGLDQTQKNALAQMVQNSANLNKSGDLASHALDKAVEMQKQKNAQQTSEKMRKDIKDDFKDDPEAQKQYLKKHYDNMLGVSPKDDNKTLMDNDAVKSKIANADNVTYSGDEGTISIEGGKKDLKAEAKVLMKKLKELPMDERIEALLNKLKEVDDIDTFLETLNLFK